MTGKTGVHPDCKNSSNPYHECSEYCFKIIAQAKKLSAINEPAGLKAETRSSQPTSIATSVQTELPDTERSEPDDHPSGDDNDTLEDQPQVDPTKLTGKQKKLFEISLKMLMLQRFAATRQIGGDEFLSIVGRGTSTSSFAEGPSPKKTKAMVTEETVVKKAGDVGGGGHVDSPLVFEKEVDVALGNVLKKASASFVVPTEKTPFSQPGAGSQAEDPPGEGVRLINPGVCREFLYRCVPPGEAKIAQEQPSRKAGDDVATALATLVVKYPEMSRRVEYCEEEMVKVLSEKKRLELDCAKLRDLELETARLRRQNLFLRASVFFFEQRNWAQRNKQAWEDCEARVSEFEGKLAGEREESLLKMKDQIISARSVNLKSSREENEALKAEVSLLRKRAAAKDQELMESSIACDDLQEKVSRLRAEKHWLIKEGIPRSFDTLRTSPEYLDAVGAVNSAADMVGRQDGMKDGYECGLARIPLESHSNFRQGAPAAFSAALDRFIDVSIPLLDKLVGTADEDGIATLQQLLASPVRGSGEVNEEV